MFFAVKRVLFPTKFIASSSPTTQEMESITWNTKNKSKGGFVSVVHVFIQEIQVKRRNPWNLWSDLLKSFNLLRWGGVVGVASFRFHNAKLSQLHTVIAQPTLESYCRLTCLFFHYLLLISKKPHLSQLNSCTSLFMFEIFKYFTVTSPPPPLSCMCMRMFGYERHFLFLLSGSCSLFCSHSSISRWNCCFSGDQVQVLLRCWKFIDICCV